MKVKYPSPLIPGHRVAIVAPASPPRDPRDIDRAVFAVEELGFDVALGRSVRKRSGYLAGTDKDRAQDLMRAFRDPSIDGVFCLRGGYGASRILPLLDYLTIRRNPKPLIGYSDITALHMAIYNCSGLSTFHGPVATSFIGRGKGESVAKDALPRILARGFSSNSIFETNGKNKSLRTGRARGVILGGNLSILASLVGTKYLPSFRGSILFLEDVGEPPYRIDRYLTQLLTSGALKGVNGVILGQFTACEDKRLIAKSGRRPSVQDVLRERLLPLRVPVVADAPIGHVTKNVTVPVGERVTLEVNSKSANLSR